jgi:Type IV secretion-system coupling protein DNA-binding domain
MSSESAAVNAVVRAVIFQLKVVGWILGLLFRGFLLWRDSRPVPPVTVRLPDDARFAHTHIVGGSGHGKTQLIQSMIASQDFPRLREGSASVIVIDSHGDLIRTISHLAEFAPDRLGSMSERVVLIDPMDIEHPPCLNLFDFGLDRIKGYSPVEREKLLNGAIALYEYMFGALLGAEMSHRQSVIFRYIARLLMVVPKATIYTLLDFMETPELVRQYLPKLDIATQRFFTTQFLTHAFDATRQQIAARLWGILSTPALARMFSHEKNKLNMFEAMNSGKLILINTSKELLKDDCKLFGRFLIAPISQATQERAALPEASRLSTFVYIDEAQEYFDDSLEEFCNSARKYKVGLVLAHQNLGQLDRRLRDSVMACQMFIKNGDAMPVGALLMFALGVFPSLSCCQRQIRHLAAFLGGAHFRIAA